jgi:trehalose 2-sulfotransferase
VTYEDFVLKYEETVFDILGWLGLGVATATVAPPAYEQSADAVAENWVQRFRRDQQARWKNQAW